MSGNNKVFEKLQEYLERHTTLTKWVYTMIVVAILITTATLYAMNKSASAVTQDGAEDVGMVLNNSEGTAGNTGDDTDQNAQSDSDSDNQSDSDAAGNTGSETDSAVNDNTDNNNSGDSDDISTDSGEDNDEENSSEIAGDNDEGISVDGTGSNGEDSASGITGDNGENSASGITGDNGENSASGITGDNVENSTSGSSGDNKEDFSNGSTVYNDVNTSSKGTGNDTVEDTSAESQESQDSSDSADKSKGINSKSDSTENGGETDIPESVDVAEYITKTVIERELVDGSWEEIGEEDIRPGDRLRITIKYILPKEATVSDNIYYELPEQYGVAETQTTPIENADASAEVTDGNQIKIHYSDEYKKETLNEVISDDDDKKLNNGTSTEATTDNNDEKLNNETSTEATTENDDEIIENELLTEVTAASEETTESNDAVNEDSQKTNEDSKSNEDVKNTEGIDDLLGKIFVMTAHAASDETQESEFVVYSSVDGMKIRNVTITKNPETHWENGNLAYSGGTEIESGAQVSVNDTILFTLDYLLGIGTINENDRVITFNLEERGIKVKDDVSDYIFNSDNVKVGTFSVARGTGIVTFDFYEEFAKQNSSQIIYGNFYFTAKADLDENETEKDITYDFGDKLIFKIRYIKDRYYDLFLTKDVNYNKETKEASYNIVISTNHGTDGPVLLEDIIRVYNNKNNDTNENPDFENELAKNELFKNLVVKDSDGAEISINPSIDGRKMSMTLPEMTKGERYTITYTFDMPDFIVSNGTGLNLKNEALAKDNRNSASDVAKIKFNGEFPDINKWGNVDKASKTVTWKISLNSSNRNLKGFTLTDFIRKIDEKKNNKKVTPDVEIMVEPAIDGKNTISLKEGYTFWHDDYNTYTLTYSYTYDESHLIDGRKLTNEASIRLDPNDPSTGKDVTASVEVGNIEYVSKKHGDISYDQNNPGWVDMTWNITLLAPIKNNEGWDKSQYWTYFDEIIDGTQLITDEQFQILENNLKAALSKSGYSGKYEIIKENKYKREVEGRKGYKAFTIKFYGDLDKNVEFSYISSGYTTMSKSDVRFYNNATVHGKTVGDNIPFDMIRLGKSDGRGNSKESRYDYYSEDLFGEGILTWVINLTYPKNTSYKNLVLTDTLPDDITLLSCDGEQHGEKILYGVEISTNKSFPSGKTIVLNSQAEAYGLHYNITDKTISIDVTPGELPDKLVNELYMYDSSSAEIYVRVRAKINDSVDFEKIKEGTFRNTVILETKDKQQLLEASQTQIITKTKNIIKKTSNKNLADATNTIEYSIDVNPNAADLLSGGDRLTLKDTFISKADGKVTVSLLQNSIAVYEVSGENGEEVLRELGKDEYSYEVSSYSSETSDWNKYINSGLISFTIPDGKHLKIVYRYTFNGDQGTQIELSNSAKLIGIGNDGSSSEDKTEFAVQRVGAAANTKGIEVYKVDKDNNGLKLPGAKFKLYIWTNNQTGWKEISELDGTKINLVTGDDGKISLSPLVFNTAYKLEETEAPKGYLKSDEPLVFYVGAADKNKYPMNLPDNFADLFGVAYSSGQKVNFANVSEHTRIKISKYWKNTDNATLPSTVTFNLKRMYLKGNDSKGAATSFKSVNVDSRDHNNYIIGYTGFPFVRTGSVLTFTIKGFKDEWNTTMPSVKINGKEVDKKELAALFDKSGGQEVRYSIPVTQNLNIVINSIGYEEIDYTNPIIETPEPQRGGKSDYVEDETFSKEIRLYAESGWTTTLNDLEKYRSEDGKKYEYLYYISEVNTVYYSVVEDESRMGPINSGELWITNDRNDVPAYRLPDTGGIGTDGFIFGGLIFMVAAVFLKMMYSRKKQKEVNSCK
ncbi:SpaA isopeptide-forming pilin-related protein [Butyrivibrio sp. LC3010]|uniref:SpaA isopeptide-forming pilin-related protein n=1 Tax=Butyrivibrio sp. LC3010 TaxID=1280680 RepID=UPI00040E80EF|nr:SpaA isopeptide-forming pilin-related protein [Butyrivibrio sp. LC3010]